MSNVSGLSGVLKGLKNLRKNQMAALARGIKKGALLIFRDAQAIVPVDQGNLKASGQVRTEETDSTVEASIVYTAEYAIYVHENLDAAHGAEFNRKHSAEIKSGAEHARGPKQQAKFLEVPFRKNKANVRKMVLDEVKNS